MLALLAKLARKIKKRGGDLLGYSIQYGQNTHRIPIDENTGKNKMTAVWWTLIVACFLTFAFLKHKGHLNDIIFPGDTEITKAALAGFVENISSGDSVKDAVVSFCREIIEHA